MLNIHSFLNGKCVVTDDYLKSKVIFETYHNDILKIPSFLFEIMGGRKYP